jgi:phosphoribosylaminoimidazole (AIR) synthetase
MDRVFNMGIGMIAVAERDAVNDLQEAATSAGVDTWPIGEVVAGDGVRVAR